MRVLGSYKPGEIVTYLGPNRRGFKTEGQYKVIRVYSNSLFEWYVTLQSGGLKLKISNNKYLN